MGEVLGLINSGERNPFRQYKQWDVYRFTEEARVKDCSLCGRVIDITPEFVVFGFRDMTNWRLKVVHLRPRNIRAEVVTDSETTIRQRIFSLLEKYFNIEPIVAGLSSLLKVPDLTYEEAMFVDTIEVNYAPALKEPKKPLFTVIK